MSSKFVSRAPLRLGIAGGGTDVPPFSDLYGGYVLNTTICRYTYSIVETDNTFDRATFTSLDYNTSFSFDLNDCPQESMYPRSLFLHIQAYLHIMMKYNNNHFLPLQISTFSDVPKGSGLGSSSALVVSIVTSLLHALKIQLDDYTVASLSHHIERNVCKLKGGMQDHYSATFGGFNFMEFPPKSKPVITPLRIPKHILNTLESSLILYYTGVTRESADIIDQQSKLVQKDSSRTIDSLRKIKDNALDAKNLLLHGNIKGLCSILQESWTNKMNSGVKITNKTINDLYTLALHHGAYAGKVSGAGGGGYMFFLAPPELRLVITNQLESFGGGIVEPCILSNHGYESWTS